jgi:hypothetical protein
MTRKNLTCAEFQEQLPELFAAGSDVISREPDLQGHLDTCENCATLVRDLQYIADQARKLLEPAEEEPSDNVWASIQNKLKSDPNDSGSGSFRIAPPLPS